jgi:hypothetical protein
MTAAPIWIQLLLLSLGTYIPINSFGVIFRVFETKEVLISCWLIALGFQRSGVESGSASNTNGLRSFSGEDDGMRVSWNESFSHILDIVVLLAAGRGEIAIVTLHFR